MRSLRLPVMFGLLTLSAWVLAVGVTGCGDESSLFTEEEGADGGGASSSSGGSSGFVPGSTPDAESSCGTNGRACGDGGVCAGGECCAAALACGDLCCPTGEVCSFQACVAPGAECRDSSDCADGEYCDYSLGTATDGGAVGGDASCVGGSDRTGRCLPKPPECAPGAGPSSGGPITCLEKCEYRPPVSTFEPALKFAWGGATFAPFSTDVMMAPIVIQLDDDDCDGKITERDIPEIVFSTFPGSSYKINGELRAISIVDGAIVEKWVVSELSPGVTVNPTKQIAGGNFDGQPGNEIVACGTDGKVYAFNGVDGSLLWASADPMTCFMPSLADLDGDGKVEVIVEGGILNGKDGTLKHAFVPALNGPFVVSDIDGDGKLDVVTASRGYKADGTLFVDTGRTSEDTPDRFGTSDWKGPWAAVADFDGDGKPEVLAVDNATHSLHVWRYDGTAPDSFVIVREPIDMNAKFENSCPSGTFGASRGGGPPTIADFNSDGAPDVGLAGGIGYVVFDGKKLVDPTVDGLGAILWGRPTTDCSSASTGSTVFDFDGDGKAEVVYSDEQRLRIYDGATGDVLASVCNTTATLVEFPVVADVDNDGQADIVVVSNGYNAGITCAEDDPDGGAPIATRQSGVRIFGAAAGSWVRTRRVWNQHAYHITNVEEDGTIPPNEVPNYSRKDLNNFRQNKQPGSEFAAPNLVARLEPLCDGAPGITVVVRNVGEAAVPAGVVTGVYAGSPGSGKRLGSVTTTRPLYPAEAEPLDFRFPAGQSPTLVYAIVDDGGPPHPSWTECRTDDNTTEAVSPRCASPK